MKVEPADLFDKNLKALSSFYRRTNSLLVPGNNVEDIEDDVRLLVWRKNQLRAYKDGKLSEKHIDKLESIPGWTWSLPDEPFEKGFQSLRNYVEHTGSLSIPRDHLEGSLNLYTWKRRQIAEYRAGNLSDVRIAKLESIPGWTWGPRAENFETGIRSLRDYVERTGSLLVPRDHIEGSVLLFRWKHRQIAEYRAGKLSEERIAKLESIPGWRWSLRADFETGIKSLRDYVERTGSFSIPRGHFEGCLNLWDWKRNQLVAYRERRLSKERIAKLESIPGWTWSLRDEFFESSLRFFRIFVERTGSVSTPRDHLEGSLNLYTWKNTQLVAFRDGKLSADRIAKLESVPGWTWSFQDKVFEQGLHSFRKYVERTGSLTIPRGHFEDSLNLRAWKSRQLRLYNAGKLSADRIASLETIPGWTWSSQDAVSSKVFEVCVELLRDYVVRTGSVSIPKDHIEGSVKLHAWKSRQLLAYRKGKLSADRIAKLESVPGWSWVMSTQYFKRLKELEAENKRLKRLLENHLAQ